MSKAVSGLSTRRRVLASAAVLALAAPLSPGSPLTRGIDPAEKLVSEFLRGEQAYNAAKIPNDDDAIEQLIAETYGPAWARMNSDFPAPTSPAGAQAALRLLTEHANDLGVGNLEVQIASAVLHWIESLTP